MTDPARAARRMSTLFCAAELPFPNPVGVPAPALG